MTNRDFVTIGDICDALEEPHHRIKYAIDTRRIKPIARAGIVRLFAPSAVDQVRLELKRIDRSRGVAFA